MILFDPGLSGMTSLSNVGLPTIAGYVVYAQCCQGKVIFDGPKETGNLLIWEAYSLKVCLNSTLQMQLKVSLTNCKKAKNVRFYLCISSLSGRLRAQMICLSLQSFCMNILQRNPNSPCHRLL